MEVPPQHAPPLLLLQAPEALLQGEQAAVTVTVRVGVHAIQGAVLQAKAVHVDSQQELGLVPTASSLAALAAPGAAGGSSTQPGAAGSGSGGGGGELRLGDLAGGQTRQVVLLLDARYSGPVDIVAELKASSFCDGGVVLVCESPSAIA